MKPKILSIDDVLEQLRSIHSFEPELDDYFRKIIEFKNLKKKAFLLTPDAICRHLYFIKKGLLRTYYLKEDGVDVTSGLYKEGDFVVSVHSFYSQTPSAEYIQALEATEVYFISYSQLEDIYGRYPEFRFVRLQLTIRYLIDYSSQMQLIRAVSGPEKIKALREKYPDLLNRVPQKYLSSYVDLTPETFSELKKRLKS